MILRMINSKIPPGNLVILTWSLMNHIRTSVQLRFPELTSSQTVRSYARCQVIVNSSLSPYSLEHCQYDPLI